MCALSEAASRRWGELRKRVASALALAVPTLIAVWYGGVVFDLLVAAVTVALGVEWVRLCQRAGRSAPLPLGLGWIALAAAALVALRGDPLAGRANVLFVVLVVWASDIGAYFAGRAFGGPRLAPRISPGKTWSGAAGGVAGAVAAGLIVAGWQGRQANPGLAAGVAAILSGVGQLGDLLESLVKRRFGVKDSGRLIPGHGGALDRLDAMLAVLPVAWLLAHLRARGIVLWE